MRFITITFLITLSSLLTANAQQRQFEIGLKASPSLSSGYSISSTNTNESTFSLNSGVEFRTYHKRRPVAFSVGVNFMDRGYQTTRGYKETQGGEEVSNTRTYQAHNYYVNIPLMIGYSWDNFYAFAGPDVSFKVGSKLEIDNQTVSNEVSLFSETLIGAQALIGYKHRVSNQFSVSFEAMIQPSITTKQISYGGSIGLFYGFGKPSGFLTPRDL